MNLPTALLLAACAALVGTSVALSVSTLRNTRVHPCAEGMTLRPGESCAVLFTLPNLAAHRTPPAPQGNGL